MDWIGCLVADGYTLLHSGCTLPGDGEPLIRNEGVGIVLDKNATAAWKNASECWEAVSSRIVTARLQIAQHGHKRLGGSRWSSRRFLLLLSVYIYTPTAKAPPNVKTKFYLLDLGSNITNDGEIVSEVNARLGKAARAFGCLLSFIFDSKGLRVQIKRGIYCAAVMSTLLYGLETWVVKGPSMRRLEGFYTCCIG